MIWHSGLLENTMDSVSIRPESAARLTDDSHHQNGSELKLEYGVHVELPALTGELSLSAGDLAEGRRAGEIHRRVRPVEEVVFPRIVHVEA